MSRRILGGDFPIEVRMRFGERHFSTELVCTKSTAPDEMVMEGTCQLNPLGSRLGRVGTHAHAVMVAAVQRRLASARNSRSVDRLIR